jgi:hypothetical protein
LGSFPAESVRGCAAFFWNVLPSIFVRAKNTGNDAVTSYALVILAGAILNRESPMRFLIAI